MATLVPDRAQWALPIPLINCSPDPFLVLQNRPKLPKTSTNYGKTWIDSHLCRFQVNHWLRLINSPRNPQWLSWNQHRYKSIQVFTWFLVAIDSSCRFWGARRRLDEQLTNAIDRAHWAWPEVSIGWVEIDICANRSQVPRNRWWLFGGFRVWGK